MQQQLYAAQRAANPSHCKRDFNSRHNASFRSKSQENAKCKASKTSVFRIQASPFPSLSLYNLTVPFCICIIADPLYLNCISSFVLKKKREEEEERRNWVQADNKQGNLCICGVTFWIQDKI